MQMRNLLLHEQKLQSFWIILHLRHRYKCNTVCWDQVIVWWDQSRKCLIVFCNSCLLTLVGNHTLFLDTIITSKNVHYQHLCLGILLVLYYSVMMQLRSEARKKTNCTVFLGSTVNHAFASFPSDNPHRSMMIIITQ